MINAIAQWAQDLVGAHGVPAVFVLMVLESACIPIPSEVTMIFAGYLVSQGQMGFAEAVIAGTAGNVVGSWIAWGVGAYGVDEALVRFGHYRRHLELAHRWFDRWGTPVVFFSRLLPVVRTFISLPAGVARMPLGRFTLYTFAGCLPWCVLLVFIGDQAGGEWEHYQERLHVLDYVVVAAIVVGVAWWVLRRWRRAQPS